MSAGKGGGLGLWTQGALMAVASQGSATHAGRGGRHAARASGGGGDCAVASGVRTRLGGARPTASHSLSSRLELDPEGVQRRKKLRNVSGIRVGALTPADSPRHN